MPFRYALGNTKHWTYDFRYTYSNGPGNVDAEVGYPAKGRYLFRTLPPQVLPLRNKAKRTMKGDEAGLTKVP